MVAVDILVLLWRLVGNSKREGSGGSYSGISRVRGHGVQTIRYAPVSSTCSMLSLENAHPHVATPVLCFDDCPLLLQVQTFIIKRLPWISFLVTLLSSRHR